MMNELDCSSTKSSNDKSSLYKIIANPSEVIKHHEEIVNIDGLTINLNLVTMKRSFLLVISNSNSIGSIITPNGDGPTKDEMIRGFMSSNLSLRGLSLGIGQHNSCMINSDTYLDSATLASRLSKKLNQERPVYVANNLKLPHDTVDTSGFTSKLYMKIFQFVRSNYRGAYANDDIVQS